MCFEKNRKRKGNEKFPGKLFFAIFCQKTTAKQIALARGKGGMKNNGK